MQTDVRWHQRFSNYEKALTQLQDAVALSEQRELSPLEKQGLIQAFEYTHELAWKVLKDFLQSRGNIEIFGSKDATREAFSTGLVEDGETWMSMIKSRNLTSHTYDEKTVEEIVNLILGGYVPAFSSLYKKLQELKQKELDN